MKPEYTLYVIYRASDKKEAERQGRHRWPCKVGYSKNLPARLLNFKTALSEKLEVGLKHDSFHGATLESFIHEKLAEQRVGRGGGDEWFFTNPTEVKLMIRRFEAPQFLNLETVGDAIRYRRSCAGISQQELADLINVRQATISDIETGKCTAQFSTVAKACNALGMGLAITELPHTLLP